MRTLIHYFSPVMSERIRTTISLDPAVHAIFVQMAESAGLSVSRCMGDWLADTAEGAQLVALKMAEARRAPQLVMRELQAMSRGVIDEIDTHMETMRRKSLETGRAGAGDAVARAGAPGRLAAPPSSNTGGKVPQENPKPRGRKSS